MIHFLRIFHLFVLTTLSVVATAQIHYVKEGGTGDGSSWADASGDLRQVLLGLADGDTVWVAEGVYKPSDCTICTETDREETFLVSHAVTLLGGFPGSGAPGLGDRDWVAHPTILSGNLGDSGDDSDNAYSVTNVNHPSDTVLLSGFTIEKGNANGPLKKHGAGIFYISDGEDVTLQVHDCTFLQNKAMGYGGAVYSQGIVSDINFIDCRMENNEAYKGGAIHLNGEVNLGKIVNCRFKLNVAVLGGAVYIEEYPTIMLGCIFHGNLAHKGGAVFLKEINDNMELIYNCTFVQNTGSGIYIEFIRKRIKLYNNLYWKNEGFDIRIEEYYSIPFVHGPPLSQQYLLTDKYTRAEICNVPHSVNCCNYGASNPFYHLQSGNLNLLPGGSAVNVGGLEEELSDLGLITDVTGQPRIFETIDLGAIELQEESCEADDFYDILFVNAIATGLENGTSWENAFTRLQDAIDLANRCGTPEIWVAEGTYIPDDCTGCDGSDPRLYTFEFPYQNFCENDFNNELVLYGGFPNNGNPEMQDRNWEAHPVILSGDLGVENDPADNSYHVVSAKANIHLDGFTITNGNANGEDLKHQNGGGLHIANEATLVNCQIVDNYAQVNGGGLYSLLYPGRVFFVFSYLKTQQFDNCLFASNQAGQNGGAVFNGAIIATGSAFENNISGNDGGAIFAQSLNMSNCELNNNSATGTGGAVHSQHHFNFNSFNHCTFSGNSAASGGAGFLFAEPGKGENGDVFEQALFVNKCFFQNNTATSVGGAIYCIGCETTTVEQSLFTGNTAQNDAGVMYAEYVDAEGNSLHYETNFYNCTFALNTSDEGAAIFSTSYQGYEELFFINNIFWNNHTPTNPVLFKGKVDLSYALLDVADCTGIGSELNCGKQLLFGASNPFIDSSANNFTLNDSTPAIDNADKEVAWYIDDYDLAGNPRFQSVFPDMGAYEFSDFSDCTNPNITLSTQEAVDSFPLNYPGMTSVDCNLIVQGSNVTNLDSLIGIAEIGGHLVLKENYLLSDISGLSNLTSIGGHLLLQYNTDLEQLAGLDHLDSIGGDCMIKYMYQLNDLTALSSLDWVGGNMWFQFCGLNDFSGLENLESVQAGLWIENVGLNSLKGLENIGRIHQDLIIRDLDYLTSMDSLKGLSYIGGSLQLIDNGMESLDGLTSLDTIGETLWIERNYGLNEEGGLNNLQYIGQDFHFKNNNNTTYIGNFPQLHSIGRSMIILENDSITSIGYFPMLTAIDTDFIVDDNDMLLSIQGLSSIQSVGNHMRITGNESILHLNPDNSLLEIGGTLEVYRNYNLETLQGLNNLSDVGQHILILNNNNLVEVTSLQGINYIGGDFKINKNPNLESIPSFPMLTQIGGRFEVAYNQSLNFIDGSPNLTVIGGSFNIGSNGLLQTISSFDELTSIGGNFHINLNHNLTELAEFENLVSVGNSFIVNKCNLSQLEGFPSLSEIQNDFIVSRNDSLIFVEGLQSLNHLGGSFRMQRNSSLTDIGQYPNLDTIGGDFYTFPFNNSTTFPLTNISGLSSLIYVGGNFTLGSSSISDLSGLSNLNHVERSFTLKTLTEITSLEGMDNLTSVGNLRIENCNRLKNLDTFDGVDLTGQQIHLLFNDSLTNIELLNQFVPDQFNFLEITNNPSLSICSEPFVCAYLEGGRPATIFNNLSGCNSEIEVLCYCAGFDDLDGDGFPLADDCDDSNSDINPSVPEIPYNTINDDCDGNTPDDDLDGDGFPLADDCDDQNPDINPNADDIPNNGIDEDCDGEDATISAKETVSLRPQVFPNPTSSKITVIFPVLAQATATLKTTTGKTILQHSFRQQTTLDLTELTSGVYVLLVNTEEGQWMERVVVL